MPKLLLFDIDGTLIQSKGASRDAKARAMELVFGTAATVRTHHFGGKTDWQILREVLSPVGITSEEIGKKMARYEQVFAEKMAESIVNFEVTALPGVIELLDVLHGRSDVMLGLLTGNTSLTAPIKLRAAGIKPELFVVGAYGSEADARNDLPTLALKRAIALNQTELAPEDLIIIGDTVKDVEAARAVGGIAVVVFTGYEERANLIASQPDYMLEDLTSFLDIVLLDK